jgi:glycosyltransferase involved in cell wall biosynthesis
VRGALGVALGVLTAEGPAAARDRMLDRLAEWRRRRAFPLSRAGDTVAAPLVNVLPTPPARRLGGVQIQFLHRLEREADERACAVLYPDTRGYRLERQHGPRRDALALAGPVVTSPLALEDAAFEAAVLRAAETSGAAAVHVEALSGVPPASVLRVGRAGLRIVLSLHDFALFCPRPDLLERPASRFCGYCRDLARCHACLGHGFRVARDFQRRYRELGAELLASADAVVYPSDFLRSTFRDLVPGLDPARQRVIAPASPVSLASPEPRDAPARPRHLAFVGAVQTRKGAGVFEDVVRQLRDAGARGVRWSVLGGGEPDRLRALRPLPGVSVRGYYRAGSLPRLLQRRHVDLALLLSIIPESYGLTLDECRAAGVPVIAFDHGAVAERVRARGGGALVPPEAGASGVVALVREILDGRRALTARAPAGAVPRALHPALAHLALYRELGVL